MPLTNPPPPVVGTPPTYFTSSSLGSENPTTANAGILPTTTFANATAPLYAALGSGGGGGGVDSVTAGAGLVAAPTTGAVVVSMPNVGPGAGAIANPASITLDAQGRVSAAASLGYTPVAPAALAAYAPLAGAVFTGAVQGIAPVANADFTTKQYVDSQIIAGGGVQSVTTPANSGITIAGTPENPTVAVTTQVGVVPGAYTNANVTVDSHGLITAVASGSAPATLAAGTNIALDTTTTPGTTIIKQDITSAINMNSNEINNTGNITAPVGAQLDIKAGEINLVQSASALEAPPPVAFPFPSVMNLTAVGGIGLVAGGGIGIDAGGIVQIAAAGPVSIGSGNVLGATTEIEHVAFKDNTITNANAGELITITGVESINTVTFSPAGAVGAASVAATGAVSGATVSASGAVNGASVTATAGNIHALNGSILASGAGLGSGQIEAQQKIIAPFAEIDSVFTGQIQLGDNAGVNELTLIGNDPATHIISAKPEGYVGAPGGVLDTLINPVGLILTGNELAIGAKDGQGDAVTMATVDLAPALAAYVPLAGTAVGAPVTGTIQVEPTTGSIESKNITTALLTPLPSVGYISALGPMQVEGGNFLVANPAGSEIGLAASANPAPGEVATITYNYTSDDLIHLNKFMEAPGAVLDGNDVVPLLTFKDAQTFYVSKQGADTNSGAANAPFLTVQAAVTAALATGSEAVVDIAVGTYEENITIASVAGILLRGCAQSDRVIEGTTLKGVISITVNGVDNLHNNQVVITGCTVLGHIHDTSSKQHTLIVDGCRIEGDNSNGGKAIEVQMTATTGRTIVSNCIITQEAGTTGTNPLISVNSGWLDMNQVQATVRAEGCAVTMTGASLITRMANCALTSDSASANPNALVFLNSTSATPHAMALTSFLYSVATSKTTPAILATRPSPGAIYATVANCVFGIAGTLAAGNVIQYGAGTALVLLVAANRSLNTAAGAYASQIQAGATVLPLTMVGETSVASVNGLSGALTLAAGSGLSLGTVGNTLTLTNTRNGVVESVTSGGAGISVTGTTANPVINNTGVTQIIAGTNISVTSETGVVTISAIGGGGGGSSVNSVSAGVGISLSGTAADVIVNNAGVLSLTAQGGITNVGTASDPILELSGVGTVTFQDVNATNVATDDLTSTNFPTVPGSALPTQPRQLVPKAYVDGQSYGVQSVTAADSSINVGGTSANVTLSVAASGVSGGSYTNASITVGADGRLTAASSGTAPVLSVSGTAGEISSSDGINPVLSLANAGTAGTYAYPSSVQTDAKGRVVAVTAGMQPINSVIAGAGIGVVTDAGSATVSNTGVLTMEANGSSIVVEGDAQNPRVRLPVQATLAPGTYDWASVSINENGIITSATSSGTPYTSLTAGNGVDITSTGIGAATIANTGVVSLNSLNGSVSLAAGANITIDDTTVPGVISIAASGGGGGGVTSVAGVPGQITVSNGTTNAVVGMAAFGAGEATYNIAGGTIAVDDYGRVISATGVDQTTLNTKSGAITLAAGTNVTIDNSVPNTITINASGGGGGGVASVSGTDGVTVDNTDPANPIVSLQTLGGLTPGDYVAPNISVNSKGQITFASSGTYGIVNSVVAGGNISVDSTDPYNPIVSLNGISGNATGNIEMGANTLNSDTYITANSFLGKVGFVGFWNGGFGNDTYAIPYQDANAEASMAICKVDAAQSEVAGSRQLIYTSQYNPLVTTPFATSPSFVAPIGTNITNSLTQIVAGAIALNNQNWMTDKLGYYGILGNISLVTNSSQPLRWTVTGQITGKAAVTFVAQYVSSGQYHTVPLNNISYGFGTNGQIQQGDTLTIRVYAQTITSLATTQIATAVPVLPVVLSPLSMPL